MSRYTIRVELYETKTESDYDILHEEMSKEGFYRTIQVQGENLVHQMPSAEYNYVNRGDLDTPGVLELAKTAAKRTDKKFGLLVTKADGKREWYNLFPAK